MEVALQWTFSNSNFLWMVRLQNQLIAPLERIFVIYSQIKNKPFYDLVNERKYSIYGFNHFLIFFNLIGKSVLNSDIESSRWAWLKPSIVSKKVTKMWFWNWGWDRICQSKNYKWLLTSLLCQLFNHFERDRAKSPKIRSF